MELPLPYGRSPRRVSLPDDAVVVSPADLPPISDPRHALRCMLRKPIGTPALREIAKGKRTVTIVINDVTRPTPTGLLIGEILPELAAAGIREEEITLLVATGNHRPNTPDELRSMLGDELAIRLRWVNHDCEDPSGLVLIGQTRRGLPVEVNRLVAEADLTILTGMITPHQTAGYSGGRKGIMPGVAGVKSLQQHHSFPLRSERPVSGQMKGNPFHEEAVAAARIAGVDFIVNVVKNTCGDIVGVVAGELEQAHEAGVEICARAWVVTLPAAPAIVLVTPGGYPKDIDLHQTQKAVAAVEPVLRPGCPIVVMAACPDGAGKFGSALASALTPQEVIDRFYRAGFSAGEHTSKAYMWARVLAKHPVFVVTDGISRTELESMFFNTATSLEHALAQARRIAPEPGYLLVVPFACDCMVRLREDHQS